MEKTPVKHQTSHNKMAKKTQKEVKSQSLLSRIGNNGKQPRKEPKKDVNPLLARLDTSKHQQKRDETKINPLLAALTKGRAKNQSNNRVTKSTKSAKSANATQSRTKRTESRTRNQQQQQQQLKTQRQLKKNPLFLKIKNASTPDFLKISNLETGTTADDLQRVLEGIAPVKVVKVHETGHNCVGEVIFNDTNKLKEAARQLHGAIADGRVLQATITKDSVTGINVVK